MPMDFPDLKTLRNHYDRPDAVPYKDGESEDVYRERCAVYMETVWKDPVEANEIRTKKGWDQWDDKEAEVAIQRHPNPVSNPMLLNRMIDRKRKSL